MITRQFGVVNVIITRKWCGHAPRPAIVMITRQFGVVNVMITRKWCGHAPRPAIVMITRKRCFKNFTLEKCIYLFFSFLIF